MKDATANPFNITKAVDFSDQEINDYWVDIPSGAGFTAMAKPTSPMPMLILGGKGSGKTHIMRYFSYPLQHIRHRVDVLKGIQDDGYIGIYFRCGGLNSARFRGKGQSEGTWAEVFAYYMELWLSQLVLTTLLSATSEASGLEDHEPHIVASLSRLIDLGEHAPPKSLLGVNELLRDLQRELDAAINNAAITRALPIRIAVTRGDLIFGIPQVIAQSMPCFRDCSFLYLIDEFENLSEIQQKYVNTLLRERQSPSSFKIGSRMYGIKTYSTYSADEDNKEGSEFEVLHLDAVLRANQHYDAFAKRLIAKRLAEYDRLPQSSDALESIANSLARCFEEPDASRFAALETAFVIEKYQNRERPYFKKLRQHLERGLSSGATLGLRDQQDVDVAIRRLQIPQLPLLEKLNIFLLYKEWSSKRNLMEASIVIEGECQQCVDGIGTSDDGRYNRTLHHFKADLLAQLYRETDQKQPFVGLNTFIEISSGLPRNLLILLKHMFAWATFNGEEPFRGRPITMRSQQAGVLEASEWFYQDARMIGRDGQLVMDSINRLGTLFRGIRFSEKPSECSCSTFSADVSRSSEATRRLLGVAEKWSLLINVGRQRDRNTDRVDLKYQLNRMLAPRWDLAIYRRGVLALTPPELDSVFDPAHSVEFDEFSKIRVSRMSAPFFGRTPGGASQEPTQRPFGLFPEPE